MRSGLSLLRRTNGELRFSRSVRASRSREPPSVDAFSETTHGATCRLSSHFHSRNLRSSPLPPPQGETQSGHGVPLTLLLSCRSSSFPYVTSVRDLPCPMFSKGSLYRRLHHCALEDVPFQAICGMHPLALREFLMSLFAK